MATPSIVQFVVISGRKIPNALYRAGDTFLSTISTICTRAAITKMNERVCRNPNPNGSSTNFWSRYVQMVASTITNATAADMPNAVSIFFDTPRNGQIPKNCASTMLLTNTAAMKIIM